MEGWGRCAYESGPVAELSEIPEREIFMSGANVPFGSLTYEQASARADELRAATGWGLTARVGPIARARRELANAIHASGAARAGDLYAQTLRELAPKLWLVLPRRD